MKDILLVSYSFIAALIGAGFASGQEIMCYFVRFGRMGIIGIIITSLFFAVYIYSVLSVCILCRAFSFDSFLNRAANRHMRRLIKICSVIFSFAVFSAMLSAFGSLLTAVGIPTRAGSLITAVACILIFCGGIEKIFDLNGLLGLLLTAAVITCCAYMLRYREYHTFSPLSGAAASGGIYSGYNLLSVTPVLALMSRRLSDRKDAAAASMISAFASALLMTAIYALLSIYANRIPLGDLPMLTLAKRQNGYFAAIYYTIMVIASLTTLLSSGGSLIETLNPRRSPLLTAMICMCGYFVAGAGFGSIVDKGYRICGIVGLALCVYIILATMKSKKIKEF